MEPKSTSTQPADGSPEKSGWKLKVTGIIDMVVKLIPVFVTVVIAIMANNFQSAMSTTNLLSQREQADSTLRANMFEGLISPILGSQKGNDIPVDREQLMVELLALNFHENFELKPIMLHVENRLVKEQSNNKNHTGQTPQQSLRSIANRVVQRQLAAITKGEDGSTPGQQACIYRINLYTPKQPEIQEKNPCPEFNSHFGELMQINSPNGAYHLHLQVNIPEGKSLEDQIFQAAMLIEDKKSTKVVAKYDFLLTRFDFPYTDNTLLADGTRFSLVINAVDAKEKEASFNLVWFPQDYFSARERPINHRQFREKLGISLNQ